MSQQDVSEKREKSAAEIFVVVVMILIFMATFISYFLKQNDQMSHAGFNRLANNFSAQINAVHAQWLMDGKPLRMKVSSLHSTDEELILLNKQGWVTGDGKSDVLMCEQIWGKVLNISMEYMRSPISAIKIDKSDSQQSICRYALSAEVFFDYYINTGKVHM
jgi:competence protein ComGC